MTTPTPSADAVERDALYGWTDEHREFYSLLRHRDKEGVLERDEWLALDMLIALHARIDELRAERDALLARVGTWHDCKAQSDRVDTARAEAERLTKALHDIRTEAAPYMTDEYAKLAAIYADVRSIDQIAHQALTPKEAGDGK